MAGGAPREHRTDSLSAAYKNLKPDDDWTSRYSELLDHYGMVGTRDNRSVSHENGSVEGTHRHLIDELDQALLLRGYRDLDSRADYERFVRDIVMRRNPRVGKAFQVEREALRALPPRRTTDYTEEDALVTRNAVAITEGDDLAALEMLVSAIPEVVAAFLRCSRCAVAVDD